MKALILPIFALTLSSASAIAASPVLVKRQNYAGGYITDVCKFYNKLVVIRTSDGHGGNTVSKKRTKYSRSYLSALVKSAKSYSLEEIALPEGLYGEGHVYGYYLENGRSRKLTISKYDYLADKSMTSRKGEAADKLRAISNKYCPDPID